MAVRAMPTMSYVGPEVTALGTGLSHIINQSFCQEYMEPEKVYTLSSPVFSSPGLAFCVQCVPVFLLELCVLNQSHIPHLLLSLDCIVLQSLSHSFFFLGSMAVSHSPVFTLSPSLLPSSPPFLQHLGVSLQ